MVFVFFQQTDNYGCISEMVKTKLFQLKRSGYEDKLRVEAKIKEEETGMNHLKTHVISPGETSLPSRNEGEKQTFAFLES